MTATATPAANLTIQSPKEQFLTSFTREVQTTLRVLRAYPADKAGMQPHPTCRTARELAFIFVVEQGMSELAITQGFDWSKPMPTPSAPESMSEIVDAFDASQKRFVETVRGTPDEKLLTGTVSFAVAPKTIGDVPMLQFLWMMLMDQIHHRGQFSIYLRIAGAKVPSIYGPSGDEPWF